MFPLPFNLAGSNDCYFWGDTDPFKVIDLEDLTSTHEFTKGVKYLSCTWGQTIDYLDASGNWEQVNISANAFQMLPVNGQQRYQRVKVQAFHVLCYCRLYAYIDILQKNDWYELR